MASQDLELSHTRVRTTLFAALSLAALNVNTQRIKGSDTVLLVTQRTAERFVNQELDTRVTITRGGTGMSILALLDSTIDIIMASRPIRFNEEMKAKAAKRDIGEVIVAYGALAVVIHLSDPAKRLTRRRFGDISRDRIISWKQVGGNDRKIVAHSRETSSNIYEFLKESVLKDKNYTSSNLPMSATGAIIQSVGQTKGVVGYVELAYVSPRIKTPSVSHDGEHYTGPTVENTTNKTYPIIRLLYYYYGVKDKAQIAPLPELILSPEGQDIIKKSGYIPVK